MAKNRAEIVVGACRELGISQIEQPADGSQTSIVQGAFDGVLKELQAREIAAWGTDETPDECAYAMEILVAQKAVNRVGTDDKTRAYFNGLGQKPLMDLIAVAGRKWTGASQTSADKF